MGERVFDDPFLQNIPQIDGYRVLEPCVIYARVGVGGMGMVFRGKHLNLDIDVAVKCLKPELAANAEQFVLRFQREAKIAATVTHQNLIRVYDVSESSGIHYLIMEFVQGESARERVRRKGRLGVDEAVTIAYEAALGLAAAHERRIVHRDIKPDNILISATGQVKVADLGLCKAVDVSEGMTMSQTAMGTPRYMPPEQFEDLGSVGPAGDVYALGATLFFLLVGQDAITQGSITEIMKRVCLEPFPRLRDVDPKLPVVLDQIIERCTRAKPEERFADATLLSDVLGRLLEDRGADLRDSKAGSDRTGASLVSPPPGETLAKIRLQLEQGSPGVSPADLRTEVPGTEDIRRAAALEQTLAGPGKRKRPRLRALALSAALVALATFSAIPLLRRGRPARESPLPLTSRVPSDREILVDPTQQVREAGIARVAAWADVAPNATLDPRTGLPQVVVHRNSGVAMVLVPAGRYLRGAVPGDDVADKDERPRHLVVIEKPFYLGRCEVTNQEYRRFRPDHESGKFKGYALDGKRQPVVEVSHVDALAYCRNFALRLPLETEWEFACRAHTESIFPWGDAPEDGEPHANTYDLSARQISHVWSSFPYNDGHQVSAPVGSFQANAFGLHDMIGNVWEWCADAWFEKSYKRYPDPANGHGDVAYEQVLRGGSWYYGPEACRSSNRHRAAPDYQDPRIGFRVARDVEGDAAGRPAFPKATGDALDEHPGFPNRALRQRAEQLRKLQERARREFQRRRRKGGR